MEVAPLKTLDRLESEIIIQRYINCGFSRIKTSKSLGISYKGLYVKLLRIKSVYPDLCELLPIKDNYSSSCFPSNEERLKYRDKGL